MNSKSILAIALTATMALTGCNLLRNGASTAADSATPAQSTAATTTLSPDKTTALLTGQWAIIDINGQAVTATEDDEAPYITFDNSDTAAGMVNFFANNGCNFINGAFTIKGNKLVKAGDFLSTMKYCPDAKYEVPVSMALDAMTGFSIEKLNNEYFLYFKNDEGTTLMTLRKHNLNFLNGAWKVTRIQGVDVNEDNAPQVVMDIPELKIHGNAGCNVLNGTITINLDRENGIGFTNLYTTRMTCPQIEIEQTFLLALEQVESCVPGDNDRTAIFKDAQGQTIITMQRIDLSDR